MVKLTAATLVRISMVSLGWPFVPQDELNSEIQIYRNEATEY